MKLKHLLIGALAAASFNAAQGATVLHELNSAYTGSTPSGTGPWITVTATDVAPQVVEVEIQANLQSPTEFVSKIGWEYAESVDGNSVEQSSMAMVGINQIKSFTSTANVINAGGGVTLGGVVEFITSNAQQGANRFNGSDTLTFNLVQTGQGTFNADIFLNNVAVVAHVQGIDNENSGWVHTAVPEPSTALFGAIAALGLMRRKR